MNIPISKINFTEEDYTYIRKPLDNGWIVQGKFVQEFEEKWSEFTSSENSVAVSSCTTALHLSLSALNIGPGDEVIVPSFTWIATANAVEALNAKPVFCDIDLTTYNIDPDKIEELVNSNTKCIIPVHLFGLAADIEKIITIAEKYNLAVVEDAACGFGSKYKGKHVGNFGICGCFSFHPRKALTTGEGGMITTSSKSLSEKLRSMRDHGAAVSDLQRHLGSKPYLLSEFPYMGYNYRMTDIQAALGCSQMNRKDEILRIRKLWAERYNEAFEEIDWLVKPFMHPDYIHGYQAYVCLFRPEEITENNVEKIHTMRNFFMEYLSNKGISTRPGTHAVHIQKYYSGKYKITPADYLNSYIADRCTIAFPLYTSMTEEEFGYIVSSIRSYELP
ncbi:MAG: DegT/DnrJ/EryC1/StrS family aminotransferase [Ignavibacteria bacterium]|nr:DegT/DnrJ/EryC1/StrS family aminotransferase [Ignavibacteria bacterium]